VTLKQVRATTSRVYLTKLADEILVAANEQDFVVSGWQMLGRIDGLASLVPFLVRMEMTHGIETNDRLWIYTVELENGTWKMHFPALIQQMLQVIEVNSKSRAR